MNNKEEIERNSLTLQCTNTRSNSREIFMPWDRFGFSSARKKQRRATKTN